MNSIVGGFAVESLNRIVVEYEGNPDLTLDEQIFLLSQMEGTKWVGDLRSQMTDEDFNELALLYLTWNESKRGLSAAAIAIILIIAAIVAAPYLANIAAAVPGGAAGGGGRRGCGWYWDHRGGD